MVSPQDGYHAWFRQPQPGNGTTHAGHDGVGPSPEQILEAEARFKAKQRIKTGAEFIAHHVPPVWLIDGLVQRGRLYACTSLTGHGKTALWLLYACMVHAGRTIGTLDVTQGNVLYLAGENPADLEARMIAMCEVFRIPRHQLPYVLPGSFPMTEEEVEVLKREIAGLGVPISLIIGDTAASFFPSDDENDNVQNGAYARTLRTLCAEVEGHPCVIALAHPIKNAVRTSLLPRGGGAFLNELDGNLTLWLEDGVTTLHWCGKVRGPDFAPIAYRLRTVRTGLKDERGRPELTVIAEPLSDEAAANHVKQTLANDDVILASLRDWPERSMAQRAEDAGWVDAEGKPEKWLVQRAIGRLVAAKLVKQDRPGAPYVLTPKGIEALEA